MLIVVVLPAPFGPSRPTISPRFTVNDTSSSAVTVAYTLRSREARSAGRADRVRVTGVFMIGIMQRGEKLIAHGEFLDESVRVICRAESAAFTISANSILNGIQIPGCCSQTACHATDESSRVA